MRIVDKGDLKEIQLFGGVSGRIVFSSDKVMFLLVEITAGGVVPEHSHPHEQMGICLKGGAVFRSGDEERLVEEGMFYWVEAGERHGVTSLEDEASLFLDVFNPPREEYLQRADKLAEG